MEQIAVVRAEWFAQLSEAIDHYHSLLDEDGARATFEQLDAMIRARGMLVGKARDRLICSVLRPRLLTDAQLATVEQAAALVGRAIRKVGAAALQFVLAHPAVASVIPGLASPKEVHQALERYRTTLPPALWDELKAEGLLRADAPTPAARAAA